MDQKIHTSIYKIDKQQDLRHSAEDYIQYFVKTIMEKNLIYM